MHYKEQITLVTDSRFTHSIPISRRQALKLAVSSVLLITGCTSMRSGSGLDSAVDELNSLLDETVTDSEYTLLSAIAGKIENRARQLVAEHKTFTDNFDRLLSTYDTEEAQLKQLVEGYVIRRKGLRDDLLRLQDELHFAMTPDEWDRVVQVLNRTGDAISSYTLSGA